MNLNFREATETDVPMLVQMLADDNLGANREDTGSWRCLIEAVRIQANHRGKGLGAAFFNWAIERAEQRQCRIVQLTSDKTRPDAIRFYHSLGFKNTHEGFKLALPVK